MFSSLLDDMIREILIQLLKKDPASFGYMVLSSPQIFKLAKEPYVHKNINMDLLASKLPNITNFERYFLEKFNIKGVPDASMLLATDLFFKQNQHDEGLHMLYAEAKKKKDPQAIYNCAIAMMTTSHPAGYVLLNYLLNIPDNRATLMKVRKKFRTMLSQTANSNLVNSDWGDLEKDNH
ncbi:hypothetical protein ACFE04_021047 [Oxalis oulophora]